MAPGPHLSKDSPYGKDIQRIVREMLREELSFERWEGSAGSAIIQLKLGDKPIGLALRIGLDWKQDHGHGGGSYVNGITIEKIE